MIVRFPVLVLAILIAPAADAASAPTPAGIAARLDRSDAKTVVNDLDAKHQLDGVLAQIGRGSTAWVELAPRLASGTDAASAEGLSISLAQALPANPVAVLRAVGADDNSVTGVKTVCGLPFVDGTRATVLAYRRRALAALSRVQEANLLAKRDQCSATMKALGEDKG
jgi:hypothetical protein